MRTPSEMQKRFVRAYVRLEEGKAAAIEAGYSASTATQIANNLLKKDHIQAYKDEITASAAQAANVDVNWVMARLVQEAENMDNSDGARIRALELLGKKLKMFVDQKEVHHTHEATFFANIDLEEPVLLPSNVPEAQFETVEPN